MKQILIPIFLVFFPFMLLAQSQQQVVVREYKEKAQKTPLEGVSLSVQNAGSSVSDVEGRLTLQFRTLKAGDQVQVRRVDLSGYEIFNRDAVDQWTVSPQNAFNLVLCRSDRFKSLRDAYMSVSSSSYAQQYKKDQARLQALRKENKLQEEAYQQQLAELENNYYEQLDNLENYVDRFARIDLSELSEQEQHLVDLVQKGNINEAVELYESADYLSQYVTQVQDLRQISQAQARLEQLEAEKREARSQIQASIDRQVNLYQLAGGWENYQKITALLKGVADADTTQLDAVWKYATYCVSQNRLDDGDKYFNIYLRHCEQTPESLSNVYSVLAQFYQMRRTNDRAEASFLRAIELQRQLVTTDAGRFEPQLLKTECLLHTFYVETYQFEQASQMTDRLRPLIERYYKEDAESWLYLLASFYGDESLLYLYDGQYEKSEASALRYYTMCKEHYVENEADTEHRLVQSLTLMGQILYMQEKWAEMKPYMLENIQVNTLMYEKNPDRQRLLLCESYNNYAEVCLHLNLLAESEQYLVKAEQLLPDLQAQYADVLAPTEMNFYDMAAQLYQAMHDTARATSYARKCLASYARMPQVEQEEQQEIFERMNALLDSAE